MPILYVSSDGNYTLLVLLTVPMSWHISCTRFIPPNIAQMQFCNVIIYSYHYLLDPKIAERVSKELSKDCIVVFDEAHNIDNVCIESLSTDITEDSLRKATRGAQNLERRINEMQETDQKQLENEYQKLVQGLREADEARQEDAFMANPSKYKLNIAFLLGISTQANII